MSGLRFAPVIAAAAVALSAAVVSVVALPTLAEPEDFDARLAAAESNAERAAAVLRQKDLAPAFPEGALCAGSLAAGAEALKGQLSALAQAARLQNVSIEVAPAASRGGALAPLAMRLEASGPYDGALAAIQQLSALRPLVFVDAVDLGSKTSFVTLSISGRAYCSGRP
jgi:hypothetical protein